MDRVIAEGLIFTLRLGGTHDQIESESQGELLNGVCLRRYVA